MFDASQHPEMTGEQLRDGHNAWVDSLPEQFHIWKLGKTPYEVMIEYLEQLK